MVVVYALAEEYGIEFTKAEYKAFKDELENNYYYQVLYKSFDIEEIYGKTNIETACQYRKIMNHFITFDEVTADEVDENGYRQVTYKFTNSMIVTKFGDKPASEVKE